MRNGLHSREVASSEAITLKKPDSNVWCKRLLEAGVAATLGPVAEPFLASFPLPDQFFPLLMTVCALVMLGLLRLINLKKFEPQ